MYVCEYCNRHLKKKYKECPGCGGTTFKKIQNYGETIIKKPPKDGYKVNIENFKYQRKGHRVGLIFGLYVVIMGLIFVLLLLPFGGLASSVMLILFAVIFSKPLIKIAGMFFKSSNEIRSNADKEINKVKYLSQHGMLIKNLRYKIKPMEGSIKGAKTAYIVQVIYEIEKGKTKCFESEPKYLTALGRSDGTVDLLIDPNDYTNYFIDFEIY